ncbi:MAG: ComEC/Rec2 family competence protein [Candidatus Omnitrophica bacterium]|nr:ComEC/Rec2 family competence protein [Candidatus Omnitrophota bacterium]
MSAKIHRPFVSVVLCLILGIMVGKYFPVPGIIFYVAIVLTFTLAVFVFQNAILSAAFLSLTFLFLGAILVESHEALPKDDISYEARYYYKQPLQIRGIVVSDIGHKESFNRRKINFYFQACQIKAKWGWKKAKGKVLVEMFGSPDIHYGDELFVEGKLHRPYNFNHDKTFSYRNYLHQRGVDLILSVKKNAPLKVLAQDQGNPLKGRSLKLRASLNAILNKYLTPNESAVMQAFLLGERTNIPPHINNLFIQTGTAHILAISGFNVSIVAGLFLIFFKLFPLGRRSHLLLTVFLLMGYSFLTGSSPSVVRSTIMAVIFLLSFILERETDPLNTLACSAFLILLWNPLNFFDIGFQLSYVCVLCMILFTPEAVKLMSKAFSLKEDWISYSLSSSVAVWLGVLGLIAYYFKIITPVTVIANFIVIPLSSMLVVLGFGLLFTAVVFPPLGVFFGLCIKISLNLLIGLIFLFSKIPGAYFTLNNITAWHVIVYYVIVLSLFLLWKIFLFKSVPNSFSEVK